MNLGQKIVSALQARQHPTKDGPHYAGTARGFAHKEDAGDLRLVVEVEDFDKYSYLIKNIAVQRSTPHTTESIKSLLAAQAAEIEKRLTYLQENFRLIELDEIAKRAQVRSASPYQSDDGTRYYYEVLLTEGNALTFSRFIRFKGSKSRMAYPSLFSGETLARVINDLAATLRSH
jgi:hypothetical protein